MYDLDFGILFKKILYCIFFSFQENAHFSISEALIAAIEQVNHVN